MIHYKNHLLTYIDSWNCYNLVSLRKGISKGISISDNEQDTNLPEQPRLGSCDHCQAKLEERLH